MHFTKALTSLLLSAALSSVVTSTPVNSQLVRRGDDLGVDADSDVWRRYASFCSGSSSKRSIQARAPRVPAMHDEVKQGESKVYKDIPLGLWTMGLVSCIGVGVTGNTKDGNKPVRVLGHFQGAESTLGPEWRSFKQKLDDANVDKDTTHGYMSVPDFENQLPPGWDDELTKLGKKIVEELKDEVDNVIDGNPLVITRPMLPAFNHADDTSGTMSIDGQQNVYIDGTKRN